MNVPFVDLKAQYASIKEDVNKAIQNVLENTAFVLGNDVQEFEKRFAQLCQAKHAIGVSTGSAALVLALKALGIQQGDEVIVPANTYIATSAAVTQAGGKVKFVDVNSTTRNMDLSLLKQVITDKTKVILPVHLYGQPADMKAISEVAQEHNLKVVEDCAQAHCAESYGRRVPYGDIGCFSFYPGKNLGAYGDAGAIVVNDEALMEKIKVFRDQGRRKGEKQIHDLEHTNERLDNLQAAILNVKMDHIEQWTELRRKNAARYNELLKEVNVVTPESAVHAKHVYHLYVVQLPDGSKRQEVMDKLKEQGVASGIHYQYPLHFQPAYQYMDHQRGTFPVAEKLTSEILSLPMFPELTEEQMSYVANSLKSALQ